MSAARYRVVGIRPHGAEVARVFQGAPSETIMADWARRNGCVFVTRYYPSRKGWLVLDLRHLDFVLSASHSYRKAVGIRRLKRTYPSEAAAMMKLHHMRNPPEQTSLNL